jgi:hypothetical protein
MTKKVRSHDDGVRLARYRDEFEHSSVEGKWESTIDRMHRQGVLPSGRPGIVAIPLEVSRVYVIYSYGSHFPMYVYDETSQQWLGNSDKYSRTTSTHQSKYRPSEVAKWFDTTTLKDIVRYGYVGYITNRMENGFPE